MGKRGEKSKPGNHFVIEQASQSKICAAFFVVVWWYQPIFYGVCCAKKQKYFLAVFWCKNCKIAYWPAEKLGIWYVWFCPYDKQKFAVFVCSSGGYRKILLLQIAALPYENGVDNHEPQTATFHERVQYLYGGVLDLYRIYHCKTYRLFPVAVGCFQHAY